MSLFDRFIYWLLRHWLMAVSVIVVVLAFAWVFSYGYVDVTVSDVSNQEVNYSLTSQSSLKQSNHAEKTSSYKKLVRRGSYEVMVTSSNKSYFKVVNVSGFLGKTKISAKLVSEKYREFIGGNPNGCMFTVDGVLYSQLCGRSALITTHHPADDIQPTLNVSSDTVMGIIFGSVYTKDGLVVIGQQPLAESGVSSPYRAYLVGRGLATKDVAELSGLKKGAYYSFKSFGDGFVAYARDDFSKVIYYSSIKAQPETINLGEPTDKDFKPAILSAHGRDLVAIYTKGTAYDLSSKKTNPKPKKVVTQLFVYQAGKAKQLTISQPFDQALLCGQNKLCTLSPNAKLPLSVYDISGKSAKYIYGVSNVKTIANSVSGLMAFTTRSALSLDVDNRQASAELSLKDFTLCGTDEVPTGYLICLKNARLNNIVLNVDESRDDNSGIQTKVVRLSELAQVKAISAYKNIIYISLDIGEADVWDPVDRSFGPDPIKKKTATDFVNQQIDSLGIDRKAYQIYILP